METPKIVTIVTELEFRAWLKKQPRNRQYNYREIDSNCRHGCPMVQYGKLVLGLKDFGVGTEIFLCGPTLMARMDTSIENIIPLHMRGPEDHTFGELQDALKHG